jgi:5-methylcytosine-specific restriction enzyme A
MPRAAARLCPRGHLIPGTGKCPTCQAGRESRRTPAAARGYDEAWRRLADRHAAEHPLCAACWARGRARPMRDVDHVVPFDGLDDPRRLDPNNLQSLCGPCHARKSALDHAARRYRPGGICKSFEASSIQTTPERRRARPQISNRPIVTGGDP